MKFNIKNKINKQDVILFICILIFSMIANNAFLQRHYSSDTMCLIDLGYFDYPLNFFLLDGRIFSALICFLGGFLNLKIDTYLFISNFIGIFLLALTTIILFKFIVKYLEIENRWIKFLVLLSSYTIIFNHMSIEYLLFPESCVMCAGVLFSVLASITYLKNTKWKILKSFTLLSIATLCYQGLINIFPVLVIVLGFLKMRQSKKEMFKYYIKEILKLGLMFTFALLISAGIIFIFNNILQDSTNRLERMKEALILIKELHIASFVILIKQTNKIPAYLSIIIMCITSIIILKYNKNLLLKYILVIFTAYLFCIIPTLVYGYFLARMLMAVGATMGISLLFITSLLNKNDDDISIKNIKTILISTCVISYFIFNVTNNYINGYEHLKAFKLDEEIGAEINRIVMNYEKNSGKEITKFSYCYDIKAKKVHPKIKNIGPLTEKKFAIPIKESLNYYCNKKLEEVSFSSKVYYDNFYGKDYNEFSKEQIVFIDDTLYLCVY